MYECTYVCTHVYVCMYVCMYVNLFEDVFLVVPQSDIGHNKNALVFLSLNIFYYKLRIFVRTERRGSLT